MRRVIAAGLALVLMVGWFLVRLVDIQVVRAAELNEASQDVRSQTRVPMVSEARSSMRTARCSPRA
jgi:hypothetical protein